MDNFGVKKKRQKSTNVEKDCIIITKSLRKKRNLNDDKKWITKSLMVTKTAQTKYVCIPCGFKSDNFKDYKRHLNTNKHAKKTPKKTPVHKPKKHVCLCGKHYKYPSGLSKHKVTCESFLSNFQKKQEKTKNTKNATLGGKNIAKNGKNGRFLKKSGKTKKKYHLDDKVIQQVYNESGYGNEMEDNTIKKEDMEIIMQQIDNQQTTNYTNNDNNGKINLKEIVKHSFNQTETINKLLEQNSVLIDKLSKIPKSTNNITYQNCGNKNMTINVYLNKNCKDAMNLSDFVNEMDISLEDLLYTQQHGYIKGISNIFVKHLNDLQPSERPIHCSDTKRLQFYIKDDNKWQKDNRNQKIDKSIQDLTIKQIKHLKEWETQNPNYLHDGKLLDQWQKLVHEIMGPATDPQREKEKELIKKAIGTNVTIKGDMIIKN
tara:strand:- start:988 stop:2277 length:1290 start_codon:yes stop_codon:yes gene_type:complete